MHKLGSDSHLKGGMSQRSWGRLPEEPKFWVTLEPREASWCGRHSRWQLHGQRYGVACYGKGVSGPDRLLYMAPKHKVEEDEA